MQPGFFRKQAKPLIGVDISASAIKMLELGDSGGRMRIERHAVVPLPGDAVQEGRLARPDAVEAALRTTWRRLDGAPRDVALALPAAAVITRRLVLPVNCDEEWIEGWAVEEASRMVSFPVDEISLDFQVLGPTAQNPNENDVLIVVTRRERIDERLAVVAAAGLRAAVVEVEHHALLRACAGQIDSLRESSRPIVALADIGSRITQVSFLSGDDLVYQCEQTFGSRDLTEEVARRFGWSLDAAETAGRRGGLPAEFAGELLPAFLDAAALEIGRALQMFFTATAHQHVDHILVSGGAAALPGLAEAIQGRTQTPTALADPFAGMQVSGRVDPGRFASDAARLHVACGLALRRFDPS